MDIVTFITIWVLLSFPIVRHVNKRMEEKNDDVRFETNFQLLLFLRAQFEVPRFYFINLINLLITKRK
jgi:hypothetical protein